MRKIIANVFGGKYKEDGWDCYSPGWFYHKKLDIKRFIEVDLMILWLNIRIVLLKLKIKLKN